MKMNNVVRFIIVLCLVVSSARANAETTLVQHCGNVEKLLDACNSLPSPSDALCRASYLSSYPECEGPRPTPIPERDNIVGVVTGGAASLSSIAATSFAQILSNSKSVSSRFAKSNQPSKLATIDNPQKGMAAGNENSKWNIWGSVTGNLTRQNYSHTKFKTELQSVMIGGDYVVSPYIVTGISASIDNGDGIVNEIFTNSSGSLISPYIGIQITPKLIIDASAGIGYGEINSSGSTGSKSVRWFGGGNLSYTHWIDNIQFTGKLGYLHGEESYGSSATSGLFNPRVTNKVGQARIGLQAGYWMEDLMPYIGAAYSNDLFRATNGQSNPVGKDNLVWTVGINIFSMKYGLTGGLAYNQEAEHVYQKNSNLTANINLRF